MIGRTLSHYELVEKIGAGGMGEVYRARDTLLERYVAVKVLPAELSENPRLRRRFLREARSASALNHRGIITIHDVVSSEGADHIIMELVDGESLDRRVPEGGLPEEKALDYAIQTADALAAAHKAGIIHRDLKPGNVMITADDQVKVLDFGLAKIEEPPLDSMVPTAVDNAPLTRVGAVLGTLEFMSPEQAMGEPADARSDIFSFGILLYFLLTGQRPFRGKSAVSLAHALAYHQPTALRDLRAGLSPQLQTVVERLLQKKPENRFQSMTEVAATLRELRRPSAAPSAAGGPLPAPAPSSQLPAPASRRLKGRMLVPAAAAALLLALLAVVLAPSLRQAALGLFGGAAPAPAGTDDERAPFGLLDSGFSRLTRYDREGNIDGAIAEFQRILAEDEDDAAALAGLARAYWIDSFSGSKDKVRLEQALAVAERAVASNDLLVLARASRGLVYQELGRLDEARADFERALALQPADPASLYGLGRVQEASGEVEAAEASYRQAIAARPEGWEYYARLGTLLHAQARYEEAEEVLKAGVAAVPDNARNHRNLGVVHYMQGELDQAASAFQKALQIEPDSWLYSNLGTIQFAQGLYPLAVSAFERAIETGGANSYPVWGNLADAYRWTPDNQEKAREAYQRALQLLEERLAATPEDPTLGSRKALYLAKRGDLREAVAEIERLERLETLDGGAWYRLGVANEIAGRRPAALDCLERALEAGYSKSDLESDPELLELRQDPSYHRRVSRLSAAGES